MKSARVIRLLKISIAIVAAAAFTPLAQTQAPRSQGQARPGDETKPSMQGMMDQCAKECDRTMQQCDAVMSRLREARDSNDAAKMRAAINETLKMCEQMKGMMSQCTEENRKACMQMMDMMGRMHGGMMMHSDAGSGDGKKK